MTKDTIRGAGLMTLAMGLFAIEDALIKALGGAFAPAQIIWMLGLGGALAFAAWLKATGQRLASPLYLRPIVLARSALEALGSVFFVSALTLAPLATVSAVIQTTPIVVALGATVFFGARVGPRRWAAILIGFAGVLLILRPGSAEADFGAWLAVGGMLGLAARDLVTRALPPEASGPRLALHAFLGLILAGAALQVAQGSPIVEPTAAESGILLLCIAFGVGAYLAILGATRTGDIAVVSSFRYSRIVFALILATLAFGERPDGWTLSGIAVVIGAGCYMLWRETRAASLA